MTIKKIEEKIKNGMEVTLPQFWRYLKSVDGDIVRTDKQFDDDGFVTAVKVTIESRRTNAYYSTVWVADE